MSSSCEVAPDTFDGMAATERYDYTSVIRRSRDETESHITSLTTLAGRYMVEEAHALFEELQADLSSIKIQSDAVDELWCTLDWQRYILALWVQQIEKKSRVSQRRWVDIKESWEVIIQTTVSLNLKYASPSIIHQRPTYTAGTQSITFSKVLYGNQEDSLLADDEIILMESVLQATEREAWTSTLFHERAFTGLIQSAIDDLLTTQTQIESQEQQKSGIESSEFEEFIEGLEKQIKILIALSPAEEQEEIYMALDRALRTALLRSNVGECIRYLQLYHSLISAWPLHHNTLAVGIECIFHERVQERFDRIISHPYDSAMPQYFPFTLKDLEDMLALGANIRGEIQGRQDCSLWRAASSNNWQFFKALVHAGAPYTMEPWLQRSPLHAAAETGNLDIIAFLLNSEKFCHQINIDHHDIADRTALHVAAEKCNEGVIKVLLQQPGIDANPRVDGTYTPFLFAVEADAEPSKKYASIKTFLRSKRLDFNVWTSTMENALHLAAMSRNATLKIIVRHIKGINDQDWNGMTPLHHAVKSNSKPNIDILLSHGADPTISDGMGFTPLLLACRERYLGPMELLLGLSESLKNQCPDRIRGFQTSYQPEHSSPMALILRDYEYTGKRRCAHIGLALSIILAAKPDLEMRNETGQSVLNNVIASIDESALLKLLQAGADVNSQDNDGRTPLNRLMRSFWFPSLEKVELLLEWGAEIGLKDKGGEAAVTADLASRQTKLSDVIEKHTRKKARAQQQNNLRALAKQTEDYVKRQKQRATKRNGPQASSNPFAILPVEETESMEEETIDSVLTEIK